MAAISAVAIANMALSHVGAGQIEALDESSAEAGACNLWYDRAREQVLRGFNWNFARKRATLAAHGDDPPEVWSYRYIYPADALNIREIENPLSPATGLGAPIIFAGRPQDVFAAGDAIPFEIEVSENGTKSILTNMEEAVAVYTFDQETTTMFSPEFALCMSYLLAHYIAFQITGKTSLKTLMLQTYYQTLRGATAIDATERVAAPPREAEWIRGR